MILKNCQYNHNTKHNKCVCMNYGVYCMYNFCLQVMTAMLKTSLPTLKEFNEKKYFASYLAINGQKVSDGNNIASQLHNFFNNNIPNLSHEIAHTKEISNDTYKKGFDLIEQTPIVKIMKMFDTIHVFGHDISTKLLKLISPVIISPMTLISNQSYSPGIFLDQLKNAKIISLFKKDVPRETDNYRSLTHRRYINFYSGRNIIITMVYLIKIWASFLVVVAMLMIMMMTWRRRRWWWWWWKQWWWCWWWWW